MTDRQRVLIRAALGFILLAVITHTRADPDLWGHVRFGQDIVSEAAIPRLDQYAFTSDREWINHEWLAESAMYIAFAVGRGPGLVVLKMLVVLGMLALVWNGLSRQQVDTTMRDLLIAPTATRRTPSRLPVTSVSTAHSASTPPPTIQPPWKLTHAAKRRGMSSRRRAGPLQTRIQIRLANATTEKICGRT